jgi:hypothetical protein
MDKGCLLFSVILVMFCKISRGRHQKILKCEQNCVVVEFDDESSYLTQNVRNENLTYF